MKNIFSLFNGVFGFFKTITKSMYRRCAIIASGSAVIAVVCLNSTCYGGGGKNNVVSTHAGTGQAVAQDEETDDDIDEESSVFTSLINDTEQDIHSSVSALINAVAMNVDIQKNILKYSCVYADVNDNAKETVSEEALVSADYINPIITVTDEEYNNLVRIVEAEATGLDIKAKILVANVVINRVFSKDFPDNVTEVIFQGNGAQFQPVMDGRYYSVELTDTSYEAVDRALIGEDYSEGALFFAASASAGGESWFAIHLKRLFEYNGHVFFGYY